MLLFLSYFHFQDNDGRDSPDGKLQDQPEPKLMTPRTYFRRRLCVWIGSLMAYKNLLLGTWALYFWEEREATLIFDRENDLFLNT